jgi:tetratricopeptide (TPR) repeat protein
VEAGDKEKAVAFNEEALAYDDEDPITLDNLGQTYYRLTDDREKAKEYFLKALEQKPGQIDTLYFLAQYDIADKNPAAAAEKLKTALEGRFSPLNHATREKITEQLNALHIDA